jgi:hypothetical protein
MKTEVLLHALSQTFSDSELFGSEVVNDPKYVKQYQLHARVCNLLARIGTKLDFAVDIGRRFPIDSLKGRGRSGNSQSQAEADVSFNKRSDGIDLPIVLFDYETTDAPVFKMRRKFDYLSTFAKHTTSVEIVGLLITVTEILKRWKCPEKGTRETLKDRREFSEREVIDLICKLQREPHNSAVKFLLGVFTPNSLQIDIYRNGKRMHKKTVRYSNR